MMKLYCQKCDKVFSVDKDSGSAPCPVCREEIKCPAEFPGPGAVIGDFFIEKPISSGGMGEVFAARQISLDRPVALKVLQGEYTNDREYVDSLFREARAAARINHPNIVQAYAVGEDEGVFFFAMELVRGDTLKAILKREGVLAFDKAARVICDIAKALGTAWREQKLVHQDIKPDNIMWDNGSNLAKLADLGLAKTATLDAGDDDSDEVLGTPQYISPEQLTGVPTDVRSDIYSLGATFFHFVTGRFPYVAPTAEELAHLHNAGNLEPPQKFNPDVPDELNRIIVKMMARQITDRYQEPEELISDLEAFLRGCKAAAPEKKSEKSSPAPAAEKTPVGRSIPKLAVPGRKTAPAAKKPLAPPVVKPAAAAVPPAVPAMKPAVAQAVPEKESAAEPVREKKSFKISVPSAVWKISGITIAVVISCALLFAAALIGLGKMKKLPKPLEPLATKLFGKIITREAPAEKSDSKPAVLEPAVPVSQVRSEYRAALDEVAGQNNSPESFDAVWELLSEPQNEEERALFREAFPRFVTADESRCDDARDVARSRFLQAKESEKEKRISAIREQERIRRENIQRQQELEMSRRAEEKRRLEHLAMMKKQLSAKVKDCVPKMLAAAVDPGREKEFADAIAQAKLYLESFLGTSADEVKVKQQLRSVLEQMPSELSKLRKELAKFPAVNSSHYIQFRDSAKVQWEVMSIKPGVLYCRNNSGSTAKMSADSLEPNVRKVFLRNLKQVMGVSDPEFYFDIYNGKIPSASDAPDGFWRTCFDLMQ